jgi:tRNA pseudouridine55 synthase
MGKRRPRGRDISGMLVLDKPKGVTSNSVLQKAKGLFLANKAGHTGTLDPMATGMLPICFGEATKVCAFLLDSDKTYRFSAKFGERTDTADADGDVIESKDPSAITEQSILDVLEDFRGDIEQIPPMYSALHHNGKRLYDLARKGVEVERKSRSVTIKLLELVDFRRDDSGVHATLEVCCSKGTYVRTLAEDIAAAQDNLAHLVKLRRVDVGCYRESMMVTIEQIESAAETGDLNDLLALLRPVEETISDWPAVDLDSELAGYIKLGNPVQVPNVSADGLLRLREVGPQFESPRFMGIGFVNEDGLVAPKRLIRCS